MWFLMCNSSCVADNIMYKLQFFKIIDGVYHISSASFQAWQSLTY